MQEILGTNTLYLEHEPLNEGNNALLLATKEPENAMEFMYDRTILASNARLHE